MKGVQKVPLTPIHNPSHISSDIKPLSRFALAVCYSKLRPDRQCTHHTQPQLDLYCRLTYAAVGMCSITNNGSSNDVINGSSSSAGNGATPLADPAVGSDTWKREVEGPYRRLDANPDALELARLVFCAVTIVPIRAILIVLFLISYYTTARCFLAVAPDRPWAHAVNIYMVRMGSWYLLWLIGCTVEVKGLRENAGRRGEPRVFVSNHISYLEILYFLAELGPSFVMKRT